MSSVATAAPPTITRRRRSTAGANTSGSGRSGTGPREAGEKNAHDGKPNECRNGGEYPEQTCELLCVRSLRIEGRLRAGTRTQEQRGRHSCCKSELASHGCLIAAGLSLADYWCGPEAREAHSRPRENGFDRGGRMRRHSRRIPERADVGSNLPNLISGILPRKVGMPFGRPSRMLAAMFSTELP